MKLSFLSLLLFIGFSLGGCTKQTEPATSETQASQAESSAKVVTQELDYGINGVTHRSFAAYDSNLEGSLPVVFVLPEWWGMTDYIKSRVKEIAALGYYAVAVDYYGEGKFVTTPEEAQKLASHFYTVPVDARRMFDAVKNAMVLNERADYSRMAVIGYCFGGSQALNMGRLSDDFRGVVSFHGNLDTGIRAKNSSVKYLVLHGEADSFVSNEEIQGFKKEMDSAKIDYKFVSYPGATHAFTNPGSTEVGKKYGMDIAYQKEADQKSWEEMKTFLASIFK